MSSKTIDVIGPTTHDIEYCTTNDKGYNMGQTSYLLKHPIAHLIQTSSLVLVERNVELWDTFALITQVFCSK